MAQIPDQTPGLIKTVKTNQFEEARHKVRQNLSMTCSSVSSEAHIVSSASEETDPEMHRRHSKTQLVTGFKSNLNNICEGTTSGLEEEENIDIKVNGRFTWKTEKKKDAVENDDFSSSCAFERNTLDSSPLHLQLEKEKNASKTLHFELKVENPGKWFCYHEF